MGAACLIIAPLQELDRVLVFLCSVGNLFSVRIHICCKFNMYHFPV
jgi:hypothetical protein